MADQHSSRLVRVVQWCCMAHKTSSHNSVEYRATTVGGVLFQTRGLWIDKNAQRVET